MKLTDLGKTEENHLPNVCDFKSLTFGNLGTLPQIILYVDNKTHLGNY